MKYRMLAAAAAVMAAAWGSGAAMAQTPTSANVRSTPQVMSDAAPLPAENRESHGAILMDHSPIRAQRHLVEQRVESQRDLQAIGREALRVTMEARGSGAVDTSVMGGPPSVMPIPTR